MKKLFTAQRLSLLLLFSLLSGTVQADSAYDDNCCARSCYECGCNPLNCGSFGLQFQAGVNPIIWTKRGNLNLVDCTQATHFTNFGKLPKYSSFFKTPWVVGGQISYALTDNSNVFVEFNYVQANAKGSGVNTTASSSGTNPGTPNAAVLLKLSKYKLFNAYLGARYYFDRWCDRVSFFVGEKVGLVHHKSNNFQTLTTGTVLSQYTTGTEFFHRNTVVSGGLHLGFDICFCGNWSLVITGEVVANCGPSVVQPNIVLAASDRAALPSGDPSFFTLGPVGTELQFPVTLGIKYNF